MTALGSPQWDRFLELSKLMNGRLPLPGTEAARHWPEYRSLDVEIGFSRRPVVRRAPPAPKRSARRRARTLTSDVRTYHRGARPDFAWPVHVIHMLEGFSRLVRRAARVDRQEHVPMVLLATRILGPRAVDFRGQMPSALGMLSRDGDGYRLTVRAGLFVPLREMVIGHELGHWIMGREGFVDDPLRGQSHNEAWCDYIGAALMRPSWKDSA